MREIKFRGFHLGIRSMFKVLSINFNLKRMRTDLTHGRNSARITPDFSEVELMQYTGLKDKNGKEIYEGDILANHKTKQAKQVMWNQNQAGFNVKYWAPIKMKAQTHTWEIIGNIYESPELMEET